MKTQATLFDDLLIEVDRNSDKLLLGKAKVPLKPVVNRGVAEIYDEVERVFAQVKTLLPYIEKYELITSIERLQEYMKKVKENGVIAIDTETDGLNPIDDKIAGVSIYTKGESPAYIPFRHEYYDFNMDYEVMTHLLKALMRDKIKILMHNAKFDIRVLYNSFGVKVEAHFDTMIAARLLNENEDSNSLKSLWAKYVLGKTKQFSYSELFEGIKYSIFNPEKVYIYAAIDALMTYELWEFQRDFFDPTNQKCIEQDLVDTSSLFYDIEMKVLHIAADMEERGVNLDMQYVKELKERYQKILYDFEDETIKGLKMHQLVWKANLTSAQLSKLSDPINIASPQQMTAIIYDGLGCVLPPKLLKGGKERSAGKDAIKYLATAYPQYASIWEPYANYQKTKTVFSTFIVAIPERVSPTIGKLHTTWNTIGTDTGRFSSREPNFQNIPARNKDIRPMFVPHSGNVFVGSDFGSQEPRILSHVSKEPILMNNFVKELDVYSTLVSSAYKLPYDQCTKDTPSGKILRNKGKILLLALSYGMQAKSLSQQLGVSLEEAQQVFNSFRDELHVAFDYGDRVRRQCKVHGYVKTLWGRKRRFPAYQLPEYEVVGEVPPQTKKEIIKRIRNANWQQRYDLMRELEMRYSCAIIDNGREIRKHETEIVNSIIQGSAADMVKVALIKIFEDELMNEWGAKLVFQVHD